MVDFKEIDCGFKYGSVEVTRTAHDERKGWVVLNIKSPKIEIQIYATKTGEIRIFKKEIPHYMERGKTNEYEELC